MRSRGGGVWREWRLANVAAVPLYDPPPPCSPKLKKKEVDGAPEPKTFNEVAYYVTRALQARSSLPKLTEAIGVMVKREASPLHGRVREESLIDVFKQTALQELSQEEFLEIWPPPPTPAAVRKLSTKLRRRASGTLSSKTTTELQDEGVVKSPKAGA